MLHVDDSWRPDRRPDHPGAALADAGRRVDTAAAIGLDPARLVRDAAALLAATAHTARPDQYATVLLLHISSLADPAPVTPGDGIDHDGPPDPADADLQPPDDLHTAPGHEQALVPAGGDGDGANDIAELGDPGDEEALPADPAAATIIVADETIDEHAALDRAAAATDAAWECTSRPGRRGPGCPATSPTADWTP